MTARAALEPYRQGMLDGLCGVYALINASRLAAPSLKKSLCRKLFHTSMEWLADWSLSGRRHAPETFATALRSGLHINQLLALHKAVFRSALPQLVLNRPFLRTIPHSNELWLRLGEEAAKRHQGVFIGMDKDSWSHWTVIRAVTPKRIILFDSDGYGFLCREKCGFAVHSAVTCVITPSNILFLKDSAAKPA